MKLTKAAEEYKGLRVKVIHTNKLKYQDIIGEEGTVELISSNTLGVRLDKHYNTASTQGVYWLQRSEVKVLDSQRSIDQEIENIMKQFEGHEYVATVRLVTDLVNITSSEYRYALYSEDYKSLRFNEDGQLEPGQLVVVSPRSYTNRALGELLKVEPVSHMIEPLVLMAEVVGTVKMDRFNEKLRKAMKLKEINSIQNALDEEIEKLRRNEKTSEYYDQIVNTCYPENPMLTALLHQLKKLEKDCL